MHTKMIIRNAIFCLHGKTLIFSKHMWNVAQCPCKYVSNVEMWFYLTIYRICTEAKKAAYG